MTLLGSIPQALPPGLEAYGRSAEFGPDNLPRQLQAAHSTKAGTWGLLRVLAGSVRFQLEPPRSGERVVCAGETLVIEPQVAHHVAFVEPGRFFIEFYRSASWRGVGNMPAGRGLPDQPQPWSNEKESVMSDIKRTGTGPPVESRPENDPVAAASWDSFPASDPPAWMGVVSGEPARPERGADMPAMVEIAGRDFVVDAALIGDLLGLAPREVPELMRVEAITSICERGEGADEGHYRLSFFYGNCRARLSIDPAGQVLRRSVVDFGDRAPPRGTRRAEAGAVRVRPGAA